jgi:hypothetical protein
LITPTIDRPTSDALAGPFGFLSLAGCYQLCHDIDTDIRPGRPC